MTHSMMDLLHVSRLIDRNIDPDGDHQTPSSGGFDNLTRTYSLRDRQGSVDEFARRAGVAQTSLPGDSLDVNEDTVNFDNNPEHTNDNNARVAERLRREKEAAYRALSKNGPAGFRRAGSVLNPGDLSQSGKGGELRHEWRTPDNGPEPTDATNRDESNGRNVGVKGRVPAKKETKQPPPSGSQPPPIPETAANFTAPAADNQQPQNPQPPQNPPTWGSNT